ncbi:hypothetical protein BDZ85DRAFT_247331 [Elsinoe ampelina]|uniref:Uncharacterized protein n=1 Tax=Elsinoe ampelina TaxID=302913 RepID=A0A6A6GML7_9PEZI|nr:hypothetical protein BDZ85DRAFT_247331 [Elsinoe ampelina]
MSTTAQHYNDYFADLHRPANWTSMSVRGTLRDKSIKDAFWLNFFAWTEDELDEAVQLTWQALITEPEIFRPRPPGAPALGHTDLALRARTRVANRLIEDNPSLFLDRHPGGPPPWFADHFRYDDDSKPEMHHGNCAIQVFIIFAKKRHHAQAAREAARRAREHAAQEVAQQIDQPEEREGEDSEASERENGIDVQTMDRSIINPSTINTPLTAADAPGPPLLTKSSLPLEADNDRGRQVQRSEEHKLPTRPSAAEASSFHGCWKPETKPCQHL